MGKIECTVCNREFASKEALSMHNQAKHPQEVKNPLFSSKQKKKIKKQIISWLRKSAMNFGFI